MTDDRQHIQINIASQSLCLIESGNVILQFAISSAKNGAGERKDSGCTPRGSHYIRAKIGADCQPNTVFIGRRPTGEIYTPTLGNNEPDRDWILTRILWLCGREPGKNRLGNWDTMQRYIYIHGTPDQTPLGQPGSHGCIRMHNDDIMCLFDLVDVGTRVEILEN